MLYITGDTHGNFARLRTGNFPAQKDLCKDDYLIICGDFAGIWDDSDREHSMLDWLDAKRFTTLFVDGNHENYDLLSKFPITEWNGGNVQFIRNSVIHLMRGQIYKINGKTFFAMGGASSHDISDGILERDDPKYDKKREKLDRRGAQYRVNHYSWWKEELPNDDEYDTAIKNFEKHNWSVDYIVTHCCASSIAKLKHDKTYKDDRLTEFFEELKNRCQFDKWYFGHYHMNSVIFEKYIALYSRIAEIK